VLDVFFLAVLNAEVMLTRCYRQILTLIVKYVYTNVNLCFKEESRSEKHSIETPGILLHAGSIGELARVLAHAEKLRCPIVGIGVGTVKLLDILDTVVPPASTIGCSHIVCYGTVLDSDAQKLAVKFQIPIIHLCWRNVEDEMDSHPFKDICIALSEFRIVAGRRKRYSLDLLRTSRAFYDSPLLTKAAWRDITTLHGSWDPIVKFACGTVSASGPFRSQARWFTKIEVDHRIGLAVIVPPAQLWTHAFPRLMEMTVQLWPGPSRPFTQKLPELVLDSFRSSWKARENIVVTPLEIEHISAEHHLTTLLDQFSRLGWLASFIFYPCRMRGLERCDAEQKCGWPNDTYYGFEPFDSQAWPRFSPFAGGHIQIKFYSFSHTSFEAEQARMMSDPFLASCDWTVQFLEPLHIAEKLSSTPLKQEVTGYQSGDFNELASDSPQAKVRP
jgi:hypothetical protein